MITKSVLGTGVALGVLVAVAVREPRIGIFAAVIALNFALGKRDAPPFSRYAMFSRPRPSSWSLLYEDDDGMPVPIGQMRLNPQRAKKLFATLVGDAHKDGGEALAAARTRAAEHLGREIEKRRPTQGPWAGKRVLIVLVEYRFDGHGVAVKKHTLAQTG